VPALGDPRAITKRRYPLSWHLRGRCLAKSRNKRFKRCAKICRAALKRRGNLSSGHPQRVAFNAVKVACLLAQCDFAAISHRLNEGAHLERCCGGVYCGARNQAQQFGAGKGLTTKVDRAKHRSQF
jgi:hypothetical protein